MCAVALTLSACAGSAIADDDLWPAAQKAAFHRRGEPPQANATKFFSRKIGQAIAALKAPLGLLSVSSPFGWRSDPITSKEKFHYGVDFAAPIGTPILVAQDGVVEVVSRRRGFGDYVKVQHGHGVETTYSHLTRFAQGLRRGASVKCGDVIGYVGETGRATGPHLHYEVLVEGIPVDPDEISREVALIN